MHEGFGYLDEHVPGARWDAKYATSDNFTGGVVDGYEVDRIVGTVELMAGLRAAQEAASAQGLGLLLWDGYRPRRAVAHFMRWAAEPDDGSSRERFHPAISRGDMIAQGYVAEQSGHSRGSTVDLTLYDLETGELLEMGGGHDLMDPLSWHHAEGVSEEATRHRDLLASIMDAAGFAPYPLEWWHYSLRDEPYPDTSFDFPID